MNLDVRGDQTFVKHNDRIVGMVRPGPYGIAEWTRWTPNSAVAGGYELASGHTTRGAALAAAGWVEGGDR